MISSQLPQAKVTLPPPLGSALAAVLKSPDPLSLLPLPQRNEETTSRFTESATPKLAFAARPAPLVVGPFLAAALNSRWQAYRSQLAECQRDCSEKAVHELRVAARRLLAQFILLSQIAPSAALDKGRRTLKRRLEALGPLRDTHVQRLYIEQHAVRFPELVMLRRRLQRRERQLVDAAAGKVRRFKTRKVEKCVAAMTSGLVANAGRASAQSQLASAVLRAASEAFAEAVRRRQVINLAKPATIHQTRVAFKRFRYMLETLSPDITGLSKRQLRALGYYQRKMGIIQDMEVIQAGVARYARKSKQREAMLQRFSGHVRQHRARALRSFLRSADRLYGFWPSPALVVAEAPAPPRKAA